MINKVHFGDCLEVMQEIPSGSVDMILADLPYGTTQNAWDSIIDLPKLWAQYERIIKPNGAIVLTAAQPFASALIISNLKLFKYDIIWDKKKTTGFLNAKKMPLRQHEHILIFYRKLPAYNPIPYKKSTVGQLGERCKNEKRLTDNYGYFGENNTDNSNEYGYPRSILNSIPVLNNLSADKSGLHPTQKPVALFEYLIKTYTNPGEVVLDNVAGSGTMPIAAENTGRRWIAIENDLKHFETAQERISKHILSRLAQPFTV